MTSFTHCFSLFKLYTPETNERNEPKEKLNPDLAWGEKVFKENWRRRRRGRKRRERGGRNTVLGAKRWGRQ